MWLKYVRKNSAKEFHISPKKMFFLFVIEIDSCMWVYKLFNFVHCIWVLEVCRVLAHEDVGTRGEPIYDGPSREV